MITDNEQNQSHNGCEIDKTNFLHTSSFNWAPTMWLNSFAHLINCWLNKFPSLSADKIRRMPVGAAVGAQFWIHAQRFAS